MGYHDYNSYAGYHDDYGHASGSNISSKIVVKSYVLDQSLAVVWYGGYVRDLDKQLNAMTDHDHNLHSDSQQ